MCREKTSLADGRVWLNESGAARGEAQLAELRFEVEGLQRLLDASKAERDLLVRRYEVELDASRAAADADLRATRDAARGEIAARELQLAAERNADQRAFLHELRTVAEEVATSSGGGGWSEEEEGEEIYVDGDGDGNGNCVRGDDAGSDLSLMHI